MCISGTDQPHIDFLSLQQEQGLMLQGCKQLSCQRLRSEGVEVAVPAAAAAKLLESEGYSQSKVTVCINRYASDILWTALCENNI